MLEWIRNWDKIVKLRLNKTIFSGSSNMFCKMVVKEYTSSLYPIGQSFLTVLRKAAKKFFWPRSFLNLSVICDLRVSM